MMTPLAAVTVSAVIGNKFRGTKTMGPGSQGLRRGDRGTKCSDAETQHKREAGGSSVGGEVSSSASVVQG